MSTIIDSLIVKLGMDTGGFNSETGLIAPRLKAAEKAAKDTQGSFDSLGGSAMKFLAVLGGTAAIKMFVLDLVNSNSALERLSQNLGVSVSSISALSNAAEQVGGSAAGMQGSLDMLSRAQTELRLTGQSSLIPYFSALGMSLVGVGGKVRPVDELLLELADHFSHMDRTTANNMGRMMGIDQGTMNLLLQGRKELELTLRKQKESNVVTKEQAEEAVKLKRSIEEVKQTFVAFGRDLMQQATPVIEKLLALFQSFGNWLHENKEFVVDFLELMAVGLGAIAIAAMPISGTILLIAGLAAAIALLWQDYQTWKRGGDSLIDWAKWEPGIKAAGAGIEWLAELARVSFYKISKGAQAAWQAIHGDLGGAKTSLGEMMHGKPNESVPTPSKNAGSQTATPQMLKLWFQQHGWTAAQASGIAANLAKESGGSTTAVGDRGQAYGLAQWHADRQANFKKQFGHDIRSSTLEEQLAFVQFELTQGSEQGAGKALRNATGAADAGSIVSRKYERPGDIAGEASKRGTYAQSLLGIPGASATASQAGSSAPAQSVDNSKTQTIGELHVHTAATESKGIVADMKQALNFQFTAQANTGLA